MFCVCTYCRKASCNALDRYDCNGSRSEEEIDEGEGTSDLSSANTAEELAAQAEGRAIRCRKPRWKQGVQTRWPAWPLEWKEVRCIPAPPYDPEHRATQQPQLEGATNRSQPGVNRSPTNKTTSQRKG